MKNAQWTAKQHDTGVRLDKFLAAADRLKSRASAVRALEHGKVSVNGEEAAVSDAARRLFVGDVVRLWVDRPGSARVPSRTRRSRHLDVIYEDDVLLVVNKPPGILSVPLERKPGVPSVYEQIVAALRSHGKRRPFIVHRIDQDTSGLIVFAKNAAAQRALKAQFASREPERLYLAVVQGHPLPPEGTWHDRIVWDERALIQKKTRSRDPHGLDAVLRYRTLEALTGASLLEVQLGTGRRNQIRIQARLNGHPLIGDRRYGSAPDERRPISFGRQALHACRLSFDHPADGRALRFEAPVPEDLLDLLARLRTRR
jgi:23S rRNA pseudouridine1911/1915/1917 synthase